MCTRFYIERDVPAFQPILNAVQRSPLYESMRIRMGKEIRTSGEIFPTDLVPVLAPNRSGRPSAYPMYWGIHMTDSTPLFNARSETAGSKQFFKEDWERRRCIVPASFYFEWKRSSQKKSAKTIAGQNSLFSIDSPSPEPGKYAIQPEGSQVTWLCGLYRLEDGMPHFVVLTRDPSEELRRIHDRMPLILPENLIKEWICPQTDPSRLLSFALTEMAFHRAE